MERSLSRRRTVALLVVMAAVAALLALPGRAAAASPGCADVFVLFARGSGQTVGSSRETDKLFAEVRSRVKGGMTVATRELGADPVEGHQYPAVGGLLALAEGEVSWLGVLGGEYRASVTEGVSEAQAYLNARAAECPDEQWILGGYSQGAHVMGQSLFGLSAAAMDRIAFVTLFGDPKLKTANEGLLGGTCLGRDNKPWVRGNIRCYADGGILEARDPYVPAQLEQKVGSWCDKQDGICTGNNAFLHNDAHGQYPDQEIPEAAREAVTKLVERMPDRPATDFDISYLPIGVGTTGLDVAFVIDTTGSMGNDLASAKTHAERLARAVIDDFHNGRVSVTQYKDHPDQGDPFAARLEVGLTTDVTQVQSALNRLSATGGGDYPEAVLSGVMTALNGLAWRDGATKIAVVIGDAPGKDPEPFTGYTVPQVLRRALEIDPVNIYGVTTRNHHLVGPFFQRLADGSEGKVFRVDSGQTLADQLLAAIRHVGTQPVVLTGGYYVAEPGQTVRLSAAGSYDADGELTSFSWDFTGDGVTDATTTEPFVDHVYPEVFDGIAAVTAHSSDGGTGSGTMEIKVLDGGLSSLRPAAPAAVRAVPGDEGGTASVSWEAPLGDRPVVGYRVTGSNGQLVAVRGPEVRNVTVRDLPSSGDVSFTVEALNEHGSGPGTTSNALSLGRVYEAIGFAEPLTDGASHQAGRSLPARWESRLVSDGSPVEDPAHVVRLQSIAADCTTGVPAPGATAEVAATTSGLTGGNRGQWHYVWRTDRGWSGTCRQLQLVLSDSPEPALVSLVRFTA